EAGAEDDNVLHAATLRRSRCRSGVCGQPRRLTRSGEIVCVAFGLNAWRERGDSAHEVLFVCPLRQRVNERESAESRQEPALRVLLWAMGLLLRLLLRGDALSERSVLRLEGRRVGLLLALA